MELEMSTNDGSLSLTYEAYALGMVIGTTGFFMWWKFEKTKERERKNGSRRVLATPAAPVDYKMGQRGANLPTLRLTLDDLLDRSTVYKALRDVNKCSPTKRKKYSEVVAILKQKIEGKESKYQARHWHYRLAMLASRSSANDKYEQLEALKNLEEELSRYDRQTIECTLHILAAVTEVALKRLNVISAVKSHVEEELEKARKRPKMFGNFFAAVLGSESIRNMRLHLAELKRMEKEAMLFAGNVKCSTDRLWFESRQHIGSDSSYILNPGLETFKSLNSLVISAQEFLLTMQPLHTPVDIYFGTNLCTESSSILLRNREILSLMESADPQMGPALNINIHEQDFVIWASCMTAGALVGASAILKSFFGFSLSQLGTKLESFIKDHIVVPVSDTKELLLQERKHSVGNPAQLELSRSELRNMLVDYVQKTVDRKHDLSADKKAELLALARNGDVSAVKDQLAEESSHSVRNLIFGNLVQLLLINAEAVQVQFTMHL